MKCQSCGKPIQWCVTAKGKRIPVDPDPVPDGNLVLVDDHAEPAQPTKALPVPADAGRGTPRYKSHLATCPNAAGHRRPR